MRSSTLTCLLIGVLLLAPPLLSQNVHPTPPEEIHAQKPTSPNLQPQDESELRRIESDTATFEQQNDSKWTDLLADDWVLLGNNKTLTKTELQANVKQNSAAHNGSNPYTVEKKNMRVDLFGDTAVVTYIKEYRQTADTTKVHDEDNTDVFTRSAKSWRLRLTKISPAPAESN